MGLSGRNGNEECYHELCLPETKIDIFFPWEMASEASPFARAPTRRLEAAGRGDIRLFHLRQTALAPIRPVEHVQHRSHVERLWRQLGDECDGYLDEVGAELIKSTSPPT
jgi:hypothetical protein